MQTQTTRAEVPKLRRKAALQVISEQAAVPLDQLARFLQTDLSEAEHLAEQLRDERCAKTEVFFENDSPWVWLTRKGASAAGTGLAHRTYPPYHATLNHRRAVNQVRLHLEEREPGGRWISETQLGARRPPGAQIPDALFEVAAERHAIEVELSAKTKRHYRALLTDNCARYHAVIYFCAPQTKRLLLRLKDEGAWPNLIVRDLPGSCGAPGRRRRRDAKREPNPDELPILRLVAEQGAIRIDQLGRFLDTDPDQGEQIVDDLVDANLASRQRFLAGEPDWISLTWVGNRLANTHLDFFRAGPGGVKQWHALNELRLYFAARAPEARWVSRRLLVSEYGKGTKVPGAEVRFDGKCFAINFRLTASNAATIVPRTDLQNDAYDAVVFFCMTPRSRLFMDRLQEQHRWSKVVIRDMPKPGAYAPERRPAELLVNSLLGA
jgi:hypothetical protein